MNLYAVIILAVLLGEFALSVVSSVLNLRALHPILPAKFEDVFDADRYAQWGYSLYSSPYYRLWWRFFFRPRIPLTIAA